MKDFKINQEVETTSTTSTTSTTFKSTKERMETLQQLKATYATSIAEGKAIKEELNTLIKSNLSKTIKEKFKAELEEKIAAKTAEAAQTKQNFLKTITKFVAEDAKAAEEAAQAERLAYYRTVKLYADFQETLSFPATPGRCDQAPPEIRKILTLKEGQYGLFYAIDLTRIPGTVTWNGEEHALADIISYSYEKHEYNQYSNWYLLHPELKALVVDAIEAYYDKYHVRDVMQSIKYSKGEIIFDEPTDDPHSHVTFGE